MLCCAVLCCAFVAAVADDTNPVTPLSGTAFSPPCYFALLCSVLCTGGEGSTGFAGTAGSGGS